MSIGKKNFRPTKKKKFSKKFRRSKKKLFWSKQNNIYIRRYTGRLDLYIYYLGTFGTNILENFKKMSKNPIFHFSIRWSLPIVDRDDIIKLTAFYNSKDKIENALKEQGFDKFIGQPECTNNPDDGTINPHWQIYGHKKTKCRVKELKILKTTLTGVHIQPASEAGKERLKSYCMKQETRVAGYATVCDKELYDGADLSCLGGLLPWQQELFDYVNGPVEKRLIYWYYDPQGNSGKTEFLKWMIFKHQSWATALFNGQAKDIADLVSKARMKKLYMCYFTRTKSATFGDNDMYNIMEMLKDGIIQKTKYDTELFIQKPCHLIAFANKMPDTNTLSDDRWIIKQYNPHTKLYERVYKAMFYNNETKKLEAFAELQEAPVAKKRKPNKVSVLGPVDTAKAREIKCHYSESNSSRDIVIE